MISINTTWGPCYHLEVMNTLALSILWHQPYMLGREVHVTPRDSENLGSPLCLCWIPRGGARVFSMLLLCDKCLLCKTANFLDNHFLGPLVINNRHLLRVYFCLHLFGSLGGYILWLQIWDIRDKKKIEETPFCHSSDPKVPSLSAFLSLPFRMSFYR